MAIQHTQMLPKLFDVKDSTLISLPGICEFSSDLQNMFPDIERSHFSTLHIQLR